MHRHRHRLRRRGSSLLAASLALAAAACTDRANPLVPARGPGGGTPGTPVTIQALQCTASRTTLNVRCEPLRPGESDARGIIVGNQGVYVQLTTSNVAYNAVTGRFTFDATLQNLIEQPLGTTDGTTLDPGGIKIFFHSGPTVTAGSGVASVLPDGFGAFTAAGQPYYQYNEVLPNLDVSAAHLWTLIMPPTVTTFSFLLYVSAPVEYPNGYITLDGNLPEASYGYFHPGDTHPLVAVVKTAVGAVVPGAPVTFGTTDFNCAQVDPGGTVTGVRYATCTITAVSGAVAGSMSFEVSGTTRAWTGATSADWNVGTNWGAGYVPAVADSVTIPTGVPFFPALTSAVTVRGVTVADAATLSLGAFNLTADDNVASAPTTGGILSTTGRLVLAGGTIGLPSTVHGRIPTFLVTGVYNLDGDVTAVASGQVDLGMLVSPNFNLQVVSQ